MTSVLGIRGELLIYGVEGPLVRPYTPAEMRAAVRRGAAWELDRVSNLVTNIGLDALAALFGGAFGVPTVAGSPFGPANLADLAGAEMRLTAEAAPTAPNAADTALEGTVLKSGDIPGGTLAVQYPAAAQVRFSLIISQTETTLVGTTFTEEGLFSGAGDLLARTTFSRKHVASLNLQFSHTFVLSRA